MKKKEKEAFVAAARRLYNKDGEIEIDDDAKVSAAAPWRSLNEGAYVAAWVWVPTEEAGV